MSDILNVGDTDFNWKSPIRTSRKTTKNSDLSAYEIEIIIENELVLAMRG